MSERVISVNVADDQEDVAQKEIMTYCNANRLSTTFTYYYYN